MSHITGTIQVLSTPLTIGPGSTVFNPPAAPGGTKLLMLHFQNLNFRPGDRLEVNLGYATDTFTAADGPSFWTRPVNVYAFPAGVQITYVAAGPTTGSVQLDQFGRGERHAGEQDPTSLSNCDPFYNTPSYLEPDYDPFWYCTDPPNWENVASVGNPADIREKVARSVGMIISAHGPHLSTCSVTLVDTDKVITAGHCHTPAEALTSSITFDYQTLADGSRPPGYNPRFYKVKAVLAHKNTGGAFDYSLLQLAEAPAGIPSIQMRNDFPAVGEQVFGVHHPNGAVKKLSLPHGDGLATVSSSSSSGVSVAAGSDFDVSGGSSGSGLFDMAGRIVGVLSRGAPCSGSALVWCPTKNFRDDTAPTPPPPVTRDVMVVIDRSGSMTGDDGTGRQKIEAARDAVSLFVQLVRAGTGNRAGLVSFSTTASTNFAIANVTGATKNTLIGPPPFSGGVVGGLVPSGMTSIGAGLNAARAQFPAPGANPRSILLLTDGLQNTAPMIADAEGALGAITVNAIGFGTESSLDGALLTALATGHGGQYTRAGGALALEKFFSAAFGNIFESGILIDPEFNLPANQSGDPIPFRVCGEETLTAVAGWDRTDASLFLELTTPGGAVIHTSSPGVETSLGRTWSFLRVKLPFGGERDGKWSVRVVRPAGGEISPPTPALRYFVNVIPSGGPRILRQPERRRCYTGDRFNPVVMVRQEDGGWPHDTEVTLTVTRPDTGVGNVLSGSGLGAPGSVDGDVIPARQATLQAIEGATKKPVARYTETTFTLSDDPANTEGLFEFGNTYGKAFDDLLNVEGNYTFHAKATYGHGCTGMRELVWSVHVDVGIDPGRTDVTTTPLGDRPDGGKCVRMTFTPRDKYGNLLGPGRADGFKVVPQPGSTPAGTVTDLGNGSYRIDVCTDPDTLGPPQVGLEQPDRPPVVVGPRDVKIFAYSVKFVCGEQRKEECGGCAPVRPGRYSTEINIHNPEAKEALVLKRAIPLVLAGAVSGREPRTQGPAGRPDLIRLPAHAATMDDCCRILDLLLGAQPSGAVPLTLGILEILSNVELSITAVYTATDGSGAAPSIDVQQIAAKTITF